MDFSGTLIDRYSWAPASAFIRLFDRYNISIPFHKVLNPMGIQYDLHVRQLIEENCLDLDYRTLYNEYIPLQLETLKDYSILLPDTLETCDKMRDMGLLLGATTGFNREMVDLIEDEMADQGLLLDAAVGGDDVRHGSRPFPFMLYKCMNDMSVMSIGQVIKVDDTPSGIQEGKNAGCITVGLTRYSYLMAIDSPFIEQQTSFDEILEKEAHVRQTLEYAGADFVISSIRDLPRLIRSLS